METREATSSEKIYRTVALQLSIPHTDLPPRTPETREREALTSSSGHAADDGGGDDDGGVTSDFVDFQCTSVTPEPERLGQSHAHFLQFFCCLPTVPPPRYWQQRWRCCTAGRPGTETTV